MKFTFSYWICLITIFQFSIATDIPLLSILPSHKSRLQTSQFYAQIDSQDQDSARQQLLTNNHDYAQVQKADGRRELMPKNQTHNYQSSFKLDMLNSYVAPWHKFIYDVAQGGKVTQGSIIEGLTACAAEDQGVVGKFSRALEREYDFLDDLGRKWDVKQINSLGLKNNPEKNLNNLIQNIKKSLSNNELVLVNTSNANLTHLKLFTELMIDNFNQAEIAQIKIIG